jgi:mannose-6-phosphate isomerase-like protein (cupin superfamily)
MSDTTTARVVRRADLPVLDIKVTQDGGAVRYLEGLAHGLATSLFVAEIVPGSSGPPAHRHPYPEVFVVHEGAGRYEVESQTLDASAGDVVIVPAGAWHSFTNPGPATLRHTAIHESPMRVSDLRPIREP